MLEILLVAIGILFLAKAKPSRRRAMSLRRVRMTPELALSTVGSDTVVRKLVTGASDGAYRAVTVKGIYALSGLTAGEGPITVGWAHSNYTVTEIKECIESSNSISPGLLIENEQAQRLVRIIGTFPSVANSNLNNGNPIKTRLNWLIPIGSELQLFFYNEFTAALTTGAVGRFTGNLWLKDSS